MAKKKSALVGLAVLSSLGLRCAFGVDFATGFRDLHADWVTNITAAAGLRTKNPSCSLTGDPNANGCGSAANTALWANGDDGDLNYRKGSLYTAYLSVTSELLLTMPSEGLKLLARGTALYDFAAANTDRTELSQGAAQQVVHNYQLLDLFAEKDFSLIEGKQAHVRIGNQVLNWGESYYAAGGINATNALDVEKLSIPGTQLKQVLLPAPMISFASALPMGLSTEAYLQSHWNANRYAPVGTYWSYNDVFGQGQVPASFNTTNFNFSGIDAASIAGAASRNRGVLSQVNQNLLNGVYAGPPYDAFGVPYSTDYGHKDRLEYGLRVNYKPPHANVDLGFYYLNYTDKQPVLSYLNTESAALWSYLPNRSLFGVSANFPLGDWAIGSELSFRPHDAVALSGCYLAGGPSDANTNLATGDCPAWMDKKKYQADLNAQLIMTESSYPIMKFLKATQATLTTEVTWIRYPGVDPNTRYYRNIDGQSVYQLVDASYVTWQKNAAGLGYPIAAGQGTADSAGVTVDYNWTYDGSLIHGWAVTPGVTVFEAVHGYTPNFSSNFEVGFKSANFYVLFNQNPAVWQAGINYTMFFGGNPLTQPYADRNSIGLFVTRNF